MADRLTPEQRSRNMSRIRGKDTKPEMLVRRCLHSMGFRFRLHRKDIPGCPDIVLPRHRAVIFVHGCFWHLHGCPNSRMPATRPEFWEVKLKRNAERDKDAQAGLKNAGWRVFVVWECALTGRGRLSPEELGEHLKGFLESNQTEGQIPHVPLPA